MSDEIEINLKGKMDDWGPYGKYEGDWLLFTVGNPNEGHGAALPRMVDDFHAKYVAQKVEFKTGSRYVAHIPYTTDRAGVVARDWGPQYMPEAEFIALVVKFMAYHIQIYRELGLKSDKILLIIGHGGDLGLIDAQEDIRQQLGVSRFECIFIIDNSYGDHLSGEDLALCKTAGHASHVEHSLAAAMGVLDEEKLAEMNALIGKDIDQALKKWPPIGGLGGFISAGGKYEAALGSMKGDRFELWKCLDALKEKGKIVINKALGDQIIQLTIDRILKLIQDSRK